MRRSQARDEAVAALLGLGWDTERIRQALGITESLAARLVRQATPPPSVTGCTFKLGSYRGRGLYCDDPVAVRGAVYCRQHAHGGLWGAVTS